MIPIRRVCFNILRNPSLNPTTIAIAARLFSSNTGDDEWNDAWETAWLPDDLSGKNRAPWEADVNFSQDTLTNPTNSQIVPPADLDSETKAFVEDMNENWEQRKGKPKTSIKTDGVLKKEGNDGGLYSLQNIKMDYRVKKQRVHAGLWVKEIEKMEEAKLGDEFSGAGDDIEKLLDSCSEYTSFPTQSLFFYVHVFCVRKL